MIFAILAFTGLVALVSFFGSYLAHHKPADAFGAVIGLCLIGTSILALTG